MLCKVRAFALNRADCMQRAGNYPAPPGASKILGLEFSGTVVKPAGEFKEGDEVFGLTNGGSYAEYVKVSPKTVIHKPNNLSWEEAAGLPEVWFTALQALYLVGQFEKEKDEGGKRDKVLFHSGASSVGIAATQLVKDAGGQIWTTVGSDEKVKFSTETLGSDGAINYKKNSNWEEIIQKETNGQGVDVIIDPIVGGKYFQKDLAAIARDGTIVLLGFLGGPSTDAPVDLKTALIKRVRIEGTALRSRTLDYQKRLRDLFVEKVLPHLDSEKAGKFKIYIDKIFDWNEVIPY
jgi:NADPH:quinone reductase-like Zn-dependent oxidoreductase